MLQVGDRVRIKASGVESEIIRIATMPNDAPAVLELDIKYDSGILIGTNVCVRDHEVELIGPMKFSRLKLLDYVNSEHCPTHIKFKFEEKQPYFYRERVGSGWIECPPNDNAILIVD